MSANLDLPTMAKAARYSTAYVGDDFGAGSASSLTIGAINPLTTGGVTSSSQVVRANPIFLAQSQPLAPSIPVPAKQTRRLVQVFIADPDDAVPLESSLLYTGDQKLTDATDQELFFEIDIKGILEKHNEVRKTIVNKKVKERTEYLEPIKVRDLKMVVVDVASF